VYLKRHRCAIDARDAQMNTLDARALLTTSPRSLAQPGATYIISLVTAMVEFRLSLLSSGKDVTTDRLGRFHTDADAQVEGLPVYGIFFALNLFGTSKGRNRLGAERFRNGEVQRRAMLLPSFRRSGGPRRRIVLIEDNPDGRESLRMLLTFMGHQVEVAADGEEGVRKILASMPDVALVDIGLPRIDGYEVAKRIRKTLGHTVILLAYTAYDGEDARRRVKEAGFDAHLIKPLDLNELTPWLEGVPTPQPTTSAAMVLMQTVKG
jgi:CheY-like chemotaxis protein